MTKEDESSLQFCRQYTRVRYMSLAGGHPIWTRYIQIHSRHRVGIPKNWDCDSRCNFTHPFCNMSRTQMSSGRDNQFVQLEGHTRHTASIRVKIPSCRVVFSDYNISETLQQQKCCCRAFLVPQKSISLLSLTRQNYILS